MKAKTSRAWLAAGAALGVGPGLYQYFCIPHEAANMIGYVHVEVRR